MSDIHHINEVDTITNPVTVTGTVTVDTSLLAKESGGNLDAIKAKTDNIDVALSTRLKPADTLAAVTTVGTITNPVAITNANLDATISSLITAVNSLLKAADTLTKVSTVDTITNPVKVTSNDDASIDAFGRQRVSNPVTLFDSKQIFDDPDLATNVENAPLFYDNAEVSGSGTSTLYEPNKAQTVLGVSNTTAGVRIRQTKHRFNYQPGKSLMVINSFLFGTQAAGIIRREGYFDDKNGIFLEDDGSTYNIVRRTYVTGTAADTPVAKANWNIDPMDGNGPSGINLNFTKTQLFFIDIEWLGVGRVRCGFVIDGLVYYAHEFLNTNVLDLVYMSTPNLPLRSELRNSGSGPAATLVQICSTVISEGGIEPTGIVRSASTGGTQVACSTENIIYAILGLQKKTNYIGCGIDIIDIAMQIQTASSKIEWMLLLNPTVAGSFTYTDESRSALSIARGATANTVTNGYRIAGGFCESGGVSSGASGSVNAAIHNALRLGSTISGTRDAIVLCARPIGGSTNVDVEGSVTWREQQ